MASDVVSLKPQEIFELVEEELVGKSKKQVNVIKKCIGNICREQSAGTQTCSGSGGQPSEFNGPGQPTDHDKSHKRYDEANRGYKNTGG